MDFEVVGAETYSWDGTSWTEVAEVNTPRGNVASRSGTSTDGILCSGYSNPAFDRIKPAL